MTKTDAKYLDHMTAGKLNYLRSEDGVSVRMYRGTVRVAYHGETDRYHYRGQKIYFYMNKVDRFYWTRGFHTLEDAKAAIDTALEGPKPDRDADLNKVTKSGMLEGSLKTKNNNQPCLKGWISNNHLFRIHFPKALGKPGFASNYSNPIPLPDTGRSCVRQRLSFPNPDMTIVSYQDRDGSHVGCRYFAAFSQEYQIQQSIRLWIAEGRIEGGQSAC